MFSSPALLLSNAKSFPIFILFWKSYGSASTGQSGRCVPYRLRYSSANESEIQRRNVSFYFMLKCISFRVIQQRKTEWLSCCIYTQFNTNHYINDNYYWCALHLNCNTTGGWERKTQPALYVQQRTHRKSHTGLRE